MPVYDVFAEWLKIICTTTHTDTRACVIFCFEQHASHPVLLFDHYNILMTEPTEKCLLSVHSEEQVHGNGDYSGESRWRTLVTSLYQPNN